MTGSGELVFIDAPAGGLRHGLVSPSKEIEVEVPGDGTWKSFYILAVKASSNDKDVAVVVKNDVGVEVGKQDLMVRVRKNAESLTDAERERFLTAFLGAANRDNQFAKYWGVHQDVGSSDSIFAMASGISH